MLILGDRIRFNPYEEETSLYNIKVNDWFGKVFAYTEFYESGEVLWLKGEAASQTHSFRDAEPQPVIPPNEKKKKHGKSPKQLRSGISTSMSTTDLCLPNAAWQWSVVRYYWISQLGPRNWIEYSLLSAICYLISAICLAVWLWLKLGSGNMVMMRLLQVRLG